jgi:hypothetical protein
LKVTEEGAGLPIFVVDAFAERPFSSEGIPPSSIFVVPAQAGTHIGDGHRPSPV